MRVAPTGDASPVQNLQSAYEVNVSDNDEYSNFLGREWWLDAGETTKATPNQIKFACARHAGATRTKAAELAGYSATDAKG